MSRLQLDIDFIFMGIIHLNFTATQHDTLFNDAVSTGVTQRRIKWSTEILEDEKKIYADIAE